MDIRIIGIVGKLKPDILKAPSDYTRKAVLCLARCHLTPPPSSTNVERLFSVGGLTATDHPGFSVRRETGPDLVLA